MRFLLCQIIGCVKRSILAANSSDNYLGIILVQPHATISRTKVIRDLGQITGQLHRASVTIGNFDGVHIGHRTLIGQTVAKAQAEAGTSVVVTFNPHPLRVLNSNKKFPLINSIEQRIDLLCACDIDILVCIPFTSQFAQTSARDFVRTVLCETIGTRWLFVGDNYTFGANRQGKIPLLIEMGKEFNFELTVVPWVEKAGVRVSSTAIRNLVMDGSVEEAAQQLGRYYQIMGTIIHGKDLGGRMLGFPTANIEATAELIPKTGVYAVTVDRQGIVYPGVANIGYSPTFSANIRKDQFGIEVHMLDFDKQIYGESICVNFVKRIREERKFNGFEALATQIKRDIIEARRILEA